MKGINRRLAMRLGLTLATVTPLFGVAASAEAQTYGADEGKELAPGVRAVELGKGDAIIPGFKAVSVIDIVIQPRSNLPSSSMENAMVCHITEGELRIVQNGKEFQAKKDHVWTCAKGTEEGAWNEGSVVAVMRVTNLLTT